MSDSAGCCAHLSVKYKTKPVGINGAVTGWWECDDCQTQFIPRGAASPAEGPTPEIPPENVKLISNRPPTEAEIEYGKTLAPMAEECLARNAAAGPKPSPRCPKCGSERGVNEISYNASNEPNSRVWACCSDCGNMFHLGHWSDMAAFFTPSAGEPEEKI